MPSRLVSRLDLDLLYPPFLERLLNMLAHLSDRGKDFYAISGFRSYAEQNALYAQGRTVDGPKVTDARGGQSAHNFGLAVDLAFDKDATRAGLQPSWKPEQYVPLQEAAALFGLEWGGLWKNPDRPHIQVPRLITATQLTGVRVAFEAERDLDTLVRLRQAWRVVNLR